MLVYNQYKQIAADRWNVLIYTGGWGIFENSTVQSDSMDSSDVNEIADQQIVWIHSIRVDSL